MENGKLANTLRSTTIDRRKELQEMQELAVHERQEQTEKSIAEYVTAHKEPMIDQIAMSAMEAADKGELSTSLKIIEPIEHREGLYQTARDVRDYFKEEGFKVDMETYENGYNHYYGPNGEEWVEATECAATLGVSWEK